MKIPVRELAQAVHGEILFGDPESCFENITSSSGIIKGNDLFIPIRGERTDGHRYIANAFENGAAVSLTHKPEEAGEIRECFPEKAMVAVPDTMEALRQFAQWFRKEHIRIPVIGITGSVGKTTTREMTALALSAGKKVYSTKGNANSQVGVPITLFETDPEAEISVLELGISQFGEMERIATQVCCDLAILTNIGLSHIGQFHTQENILIEKLKILTGMPDRSVLLLNGDDPMLSGITQSDLEEMGIAGDRTFRILKYGFSENCDIRAVGLQTVSGGQSFDILRKDDPEHVIHAHLSVLGEHMVLNTLAAVAAAVEFGVPAEKACERLSEFTGFEGRGNRVVCRGISFINDCYNASPASVKCELEVLRDSECSGRRIAVLADMLELGEKENEYHREVGEYILNRIPDLSVLYTYGPLAGCIGETVANGSERIEVHCFTDFEEMKTCLFREADEKDLVLIKGSHSMGLEKLLR